MKKFILSIIAFLMMTAVSTAQLPRVYGPTDKPTFLILYPQTELSGDTVFCYVRANGVNYITGKYAWNEVYGINLRCDGPVSGNTPGTDVPVRTGAQFGEDIYVGMLIGNQMYEVVIDKAKWPVRGSNGIVSWQPVDQIKYYPVTVYAIQEAHLGDKLNIQLSEVPFWQTIEPPEPEPEPEPIQLADFDLIAYQDNNFVVGIKGDKLAMQNLSDIKIIFKFGRGWRNVQGGLDPGEFKTFSRAIIFRGTLTLEYKYQGSKITAQFQLQ